jgi:hypothetical protein
MSGERLTWQPFKATVYHSHFYSKNEPVDGKKSSAIVTALDLNLDRGLAEVAAGLNQYFSANLAQQEAKR